MPQTPQLPFISSIEASKRFNLTNDHIGLLCRRGKVQGTLVGRLWYVSELSLEEYLKQVSEMREARKQALSKQWRTAWTTAFIGFSLYSLNASRVSADYVSMPPRTLPQAGTQGISIDAIKEKVGEFAVAIPVPHIPVLPAAVSEAPAAGGNDTSTNAVRIVASNIVLGAEEIKDTVSAAWANAHAAPVVITYAKDFAPAKVAAVKTQVPDLSFISISAAVVEARAAVSALPTPRFAYKVSNVAPIFTAENLLAGTIIANETLQPLNDAMFALYAQSVSQVVALAAFDAEQADFVWQKTFGAFGERYVHDISRLNDKQVGMYVASAAQLQKGYDALADRTQNIAALDASISVASAANTPSLNMAGVGETVADAWTSAVNWLSNIFVAIANVSNKTFATAPIKTVAVAPAKTVAVAPAQISPQKSSGSPQTFASKSAPSPEVQPPREGVSTATAGELQPISQQGNLRTRIGFAVPEPYVTQTSLNSEFDAWMQVVRGLIAQNISPQAVLGQPYIINSYPSSGGITNNIALSQIIDHLDGVTITNATITGSTFNGASSVTTSSGTSSVSALSALSDTLVVSPAYGDLLLWNGSKWTNAATSSLGIVGSTQWANNGSSISYNSGNVGIGSTSPSAKLSLVGTFAQSTGGQNPFTPPFQATPITTSLATAGSYADSTSGNIFHLSSFAKNSGSAPTVAVFGQGESDGSGSAWGGNFVGYANSPTANAQGVEIDYGVLTSGGTATGLLVVGAGNFAPNTAIQIQSNTVNAIPANGIDFHYRSAQTTNPASNSLIRTSGAVSLPLGIDFLSATFATSAIRLPAQTTSSNGIYFGSDVNLYRSAANTLTTDTKLTVGTGVQIGATSSPTHLLDIVGGTNGVETALAELRSSFTGGNTATTLRFVNGTTAGSTPGSGEISVIRGGTGSSNMVFRVTNTSSTVFEGIRLTSSGNVGIGTTSPYAALSVAGASGVVAGMYTATSTATSTFAGAIQASCFSTDGSTCITGGVGAANSFGFPWTPGTFGATLSNSTTTLIGFINGLYSLASSTIGNGSQTGGLTISGGATTTGNAYIAGSLAIGTTTIPIAQQLYVYSTSSAAIARLDSNTTDSSLQFTRSGSAQQTWSLGRRNTTSNFVFAYASNTTGGLSSGEVMVLTNTGNVGIGTTSPYAKLSVAGDIVGGRFVATTTATSTFAGAVQASCFSTDGTTCITGGGAANSFGYDWTPGTFGATLSNSTSTLIGFNAGLYALASSTIGNGSQIGGLTISGGATTTGNAYIAGALGIGVNTVVSGFNLELQNGASEARMRFDGASGQPVFDIRGFNTSGVAQLLVSSGINRQLQISNSSTGTFGLYVQGNTGIGTTSPFAKLSIGNSTNDPAGQALFAVASSTASATTTLFSILNNGNVNVGVDGLGAVNVGTNSNLNTSVAFETNRASVGYLNIGYGSDTGLAFLQGASNKGVGLMVNANGTPSLYLNTAGNVGIGTTSPYAKLSVAGDIVGGRFVATTTATSTFAGAIQASCFSVDGSTCIGGGTVTGSVGNWFTPSTFGLAASNATSTLIGFNAGLYSLASSTIGNGNQNGGLTISGGATTTGNLAVLGIASSTQFLANLGSVSAPSFALTSNTGMFYANGTIGFTVAGAQKGTLSSTGVWSIGSLAASNGSGTSTIASGQGFVVGGSQFIVQQGSGNIGIGTTSPFAKLSINNATNDTAGQPLFAVASSTQTSTTTLFSISNTGAVQVGINGNGLDLGTNSGGSSASISFQSSNSSNRAFVGFSPNTFGADTGATVVQGGSLRGVALVVNTGIFGSAANTALYAAPTGNIGIGTSSPYAKLSVVGEIVGANLTATSTTATSTFAGGLNVGSGALTYDLSTGVTSINNAALGSFTFDTDAGLVSWADLPISTNATAGTVESYTANIGGQGVLSIYGEADGLGNAQNMRVGIATTSPGTIGGTGGYLTIDKSATAQYALMTFSTTTGSSVQVAFANGNGVVGTISTNGSATSYNTSSDRRIKGDIASTTRGLSQLMQIPVRDFDFLNDPAHATTTGFIAQELFKIFPYAVTTNGDDGTGSLATGTLPWSVDYGRITPLIVKAVQDIADITSNFKDNLIAWLGDSANGITKLFAKEVRTDKLCVGDTCVTQEQFMAMVAASGSHPSAPTPAPAPQAPAADPVPDASSTPEAVVPPTPEATSTPEAPVVSVATPAPADASSTPQE